MFKFIKDFISYRKNKKIYESTEPYFDMKVIDINDDGINVTMDWNNAFIAKLKKMGYPGVNDEQIIEAYMHRVFEKAYFQTVLNDSNDK